MSCPLCNSKSNTSLGDKNEWHLVTCSQCSLIHLDPMPSTSELDEFYSQYYANKKNIKNNRRKISRFKRKIAPISLFVKGRQFLDIGCNTGFAVEAAHQLGYDGTGIDLSDEAIEIARKSFPDCDFHNARVQDFKDICDKKFDLIFCAEVIEHLNELHSFVEAIASLINTNGLLYLTTPDAGHFRTPANIMEWSINTPPEHTMLFTRKTISRLLQMHGLQVKFYFPMLKPSIRLVAGI